MLFLNTKNERPETGTEVPLGAAAPIANASTAGAPTGIGAAVDDVALATVAAAPDRVGLFDTDCGPPTRRSRVDRAPLPADQWIALAGT